MKTFAHSLTYLALSGAHTATLFGAGAEAVTVITAILCGLMAIKEVTDRKKP